MSAATFPEIDAAVVEQAVPAITTLDQITNAEFLDAVFGHLKPEERLWICWFKCKPSEAKSSNWNGWAVPSSDDVKPWLDNDRNAYFSIATILATDNKPKRRKTHFGRMACVVMDDAPPDDAASWVLETSPGNHQVGYVLGEDVADVSVAGRLQEELGSQGLVKADNNGYNPVRYVRLPCGANTKSGKPIPHRLLAWNPENTFTLQELADRYKLNLEFILNGSKPSASAGQGEASDKPARESDAALIAAIVSGEGFHDQINKLGARYRHRGMSEADVVQTIEGIMQGVAVKDERWQSRFDDIRRSVRGAFEKFEAKPADDDAQVAPVDPFAEHPVPPFPLEVLPEVFAEYATACSKSSGFDAGAYGFSLMVLAAGMIDHRTRLQVGTMKVPPHIWGSLSAESGGGKSPILNAAAFSVHSLNNQMIRESSKRYNEWATLPKPDQLLSPPPPVRQLLLDDTTTEAAGKVLNDNQEGVIMVLPEMSEWVGRMDAYNGQGGDKDRGVWIRAFDGGTVSINRAKNAVPMLLENFSVGMLAGIQPEKLAQMFAKSAAGGADGLFQRFLTYQMKPAAEVDYMACLPEFLEVNVSRIFDQLHDWREARTLKYFRLSEEATREAQEHHNNLRTLGQRTPGGRFAEHIDKMPGLTLRVTLALHVLHAAAEGRAPEQTVPLSAFKRAQVVMRTLYLHAEAAYDHLDKTGMVAAIKLAKAACEAILTRKWSQFQRGDLTRYATGWDGADDRMAEAAIDRLIQWSWIADVTPTPEPGKRGRRSQGVFAVNPATHEHFAPHATRATRARAERFEAIKKLGEARKAG